MKILTLSEVDSLVRACLAILNAKPKTSPDAFKLTYAATINLKRLFEYAEKIDQIRFPLGQLEEKRVATIRRLAEKDDKGNPVILQLEGNRQTYKGLKVDDPEIKSVLEEIRAATEKANQELKSAMVEVDLHMITFQDFERGLPEGVPGLVRLWYLPAIETPV